MSNERRNWYAKIANISTAALNHVENKWIFTALSWQDPKFSSFRHPHTTCRGSAELKNSTEVFTGKGTFVSLDVFIARVMILFDTTSS